MAALGELPPEQRGVVVLRHLLEYTPGEIAELLDLPRGTVNSRLRRGLDELGAGAGGGAVSEPLGASCATPAPGEDEARERTWARGRAPRSPSASPCRATRRPWRAVVVAVAVLAVALAVLSPPGRAVLDSLREAIGVEQAEPALFSLPAPGRAVAAGPGGAWVVSDDGSKRRLGDYAEASWSPFGRFVVAAREHELAALEPDGTVRWTLARPDVAFPRWGGTETDTRIAYLQGEPAARRRGRRHRRRRPRRSARRPRRAGLAAGGRGPRAAARLRRHARARPRRRARLARDALHDRAGGPVPTRLAWSSDGRRLLAVSPRRLRVYDLDGRRRRRR